jgi:hypothetical protein
MMQAANTPFPDIGAAAAARDAAKARFNSDHKRDEALQASYLARTALRSYRGWSVPGLCLRDAGIGAV